MCSSDLQEEISDWRRCAYQSSASRFGKEVPRFQYGKLRGIINILPVDKYLLALAVDTYLLSINLIDIPVFMFVIGYDVVIIGAFDV